MKIAAAVVTHNRPQLLPEVLDALRNQTYPLTRLMVVDNASGIETQTLLNQCNDLEVIRFEQNTGGAGGFAKGVECALASDADWVWLLDDDAVPRADALEKLIEALSELPEPVGAICTSVVEHGEVALMHRRFFEPKTLHEPVVPLAAYSGVVVPIHTASFVGFLLNCKAAAEVGKPNASFFIAYDDTEYSLRLHRAGWPLWLAPASVVDHKRSVKGRLRDGPYGAKHYYNLRNQLAVYRHYGEASAWRLPALIIKHGILALLDARVASLRLWKRAWRDSHRVTI